MNEMDCGLEKVNEMNYGLKEINMKYDQCSDVNIRADFVGKFSACLWRQATRKIFKFTFWTDLDI